MKWIVILVACILPALEATFTEKCMKCICSVEGCESEIGQCQFVGNFLRCGPYQINEPYWVDCGELEPNFMDCTMYMECSEECVINYMDRYGTYCTEGREPVCKDYAKIHNGGPNGCRSEIDDYWEQVRDCCGGETGCD